MSKVCGDLPSAPNFLFRPIKHFIFKLQIKKVTTPFVNSCSYHHLLLLKYRIASNFRDWFAVKMTKAEKNLVIVFDIGQNTGTTVPGSGETYNELIVQSVKETLQTLTPNDKVKIITIT